MKLNTKSKNLVQAGFSLVELLVVIAVIGIIAAIAIPNISNLTGSAQTAKNQRNAQNIASVAAAAKAAGYTNAITKANVIETLTQPGQTVNGMSFSISPLTGTEADAALVYLDDDNSGTTNVFYNPTNTP